MLTFNSYSLQEPRIIHRYLKFKIKFNLSKLAITHSQLNIFETDFNDKFYNFIETLYFEYFITGIYFHEDFWVLF